MAYNRQETTTGSGFSSCGKFLLKTIAMIFFIVQFSSIVDGKIYQSVQWISTNPRFIRGDAEQNCKDDEVLEIRVAVASKMTFICPTKVMVVDTMEHENPQDSLYENLWIIYDEKSFESCTVPVNDSRKLLACKDPHSLYFKTIVFNMYSASDTQVAFAEEKYYYFFSTSDGSYLSLNDTKDGHCNDTSNKVAMKFRLFVCKEGSTNPKCNETIFPHGKFRCVSTGNKTPTTTSVPLPSSSSDLPDHSISTVTTTSAAKPDITTTTTTTEELSSEPQRQARVGSSNMNEKDKWIWIAVIFIVLSIVLLVLLAGILCLRNGKHDTCFSDMNQVSSCSTMKQNKYAKEDQKANKNSSSPPGHRNLGYQESFREDTVAAKIMVTSEEGTNDGKINHAFSPEEKMVIVNENIDERVDYRNMKNKCGFEMNRMMAPENRGKLT